MTMEIRSADVIRLILQFLKENSISALLRRLEYVLRDSSIRKQNMHKCWQQETTIVRYPERQMGCRLEGGQEYAAT